MFMQSIVTGTRGEAGHRQKGWGGGLGILKIVMGCVWVGRRCQQAVGMSFTTPRVGEIVACISSFAGTRGDG
jgi:hypothetical protein